MRQVRLPQTPVPTIRLLQLRERLPRLSQHRVELESGCVFAAGEGAVLLPLGKASQAIVGRGERGVVRSAPPMFQIRPQGLLTPIQPFARRSRKAADFVERFGLGRHRRESLEQLKCSLVVLLMLGQTRAPEKRLRSRGKLLPGELVLPDGGVGPLLDLGDSAERAVAAQSVAPTDLLRFPAGLVGAAAEKARRSGVVLDQRGARREILRIQLHGPLEGLPDFLGEGSLPEQSCLHGLRAVGSPEPELTFGALGLQKRGAFEPVHRSVLVPLKQVAARKGEHHWRIAGILARARLQHSPYFGRARVPESALELFGAAALPLRRRGDGQCQPEREQSEAPTCGSPEHSPPTMRGEDYSILRKKFRRASRGPEFVL